MKTLKEFSIIGLFFLLLISNNLFGQYEEKYTLQVSGGFVKPLGEMGDYFNSGFSLDGGIQYNISRSFSIVGLIKYTTFYGQSTAFDTKYNNLGISICPKIRFLPEKKINPYVLGGLSFGFVTLSMNSTNFGVQDYKSPISIGYMIGGGADFTITHNLALFLQGGYNSTSFKDGGYKTDIKSTYVQLGINISFLKSRFI